MTNRAASGEGESLKADIIHCSFGMATSRARMAAPPSQLTTIRILSRTCAIATAEDDEVGVDMIHQLSDIDINERLAWASSSGANVIEPLNHDPPAEPCAMFPWIGSEGSKHFGRTHDFKFSLIICPLKFAAQLNG